MLTLEQKDSKQVIRLHLNDEVKSIGCIAHDKYVKHLRPYIHSMQKTQEMGFNCEVVDTIPFESAEIHIGKEVFSIPKDSIIQYGRKDHYANYEEQYFVHYSHFIHL